MVWNWPQITWTCLAAFSLIMAAAMDGTPRGGKHSFAVTVIAIAGGGFLLWQGGFWTGGGP